MAYRVVINRHFPDSATPRGVNGAPIHSASCEIDCARIRDVLSIVTAAQVAFCGERRDSWGESDMRRLRYPGQRISFNDEASALFLTVIYNPRNNRKG